VLLLESPVEREELRAIVEPDGAADGVLRASFAAPLELAVDAETTWALSVGRGPLLELPPPDGAGDAGLEVRLARTVNALRAELQRTRERLGTEVGVARQRLAQHDELAQRELAAEREGAAEARAEAERVAQAERDAAAAAIADRERVDSELAEAREEAGELRGELAHAQARIAALEAAASTQRMPRTPRHAPPRRRPPPHAAPPEEPTEVHDAGSRADHHSLGRGAVRAALFVLLALLLAALVVLVLQVRVV
jgi:hypothetical protein